MRRAGRRAWFADPSTALCGQSWLRSALTGRASSSLQRGRQVLDDHGRHAVRSDVEGLFEVDRLRAIQEPHVVPPRRKSHPAIPAGANHSPVFENFDGRRSRDRNPPRDLRARWPSGRRARMHADEDLRSGSRHRLPRSTVSRGRRGPFRVVWGQSCHLSCRSNAEPACLSDSGECQRDGDSNPQVEVSP